MASSSSNQVSDYIVLITGASAGIGEATARIFAQNGAKLILTARRLEKLEALRNALAQELGWSAEETAQRVHIAKCDVSKNEDVKSVVQNLPAGFEAINVLVNNAGLALGRPKAYENSVEDIDTILDTNVKGVLYVLNAVVPGMLERNRGHIINISSIAGKESYVGGSLYCASKHAVQAISNSLRKELVATPLRVTAILPGMVETEFSIVRFGGDEAVAKSVYKGLDPLVAHDIADNIYYVATRPVHVQIAEMTIFPSAQASTEVFHRVS